MKANSIVLMFCGVLFFFACQSDAGVQTSAEMKSFIDKIGGGDGDPTEIIASAIKANAAPSLDSAQQAIMGQYGIEKLTAIGKEGDCYTLKAKAGSAAPKFKMCWTGGKISKIEELQ